MLTAGHCTFGTASAEAWFTETAPSTAEVLSGNYTRGVTGETYTHPDYDDFATFPNTSDVGIVVLDQRVRLSTYGSLPTVGLAETLYKHELFTIVGYGVQDVQPVQVAEVRRLQATAKLGQPQERLLPGLQPAPVEQSRAAAPGWVVFWRFGWPGAVRDDHPGGELVRNQRQLRRRRLLLPDRSAADPKLDRELPLSKDCSSEKSGHPAALLCWSTDIPSSS